MTALECYYIVWLLLTHIFCFNVQKNILRPKY